MPLVTEVAVVITVRKKWHNDIFLILDAQLLLLQYGSDVTNPVYGAATA